MTDVVERARWVADTVLFPDAGLVDTGGVVPESHFRVLADSWFYGLLTSGVDLQAAVQVLETLGGGCLSTTFVWMQHHAVAMGLSGTENLPLRDRFLDDVVVGKVRAGVAFAGVLTDPPRLRARKADGGWVFDGDGPFVSGWGITEVLQLSGHTGDVIVNALVDTKTVPGLTASMYHLVAAQATQTVHLRLDGLFVPDERIVSVVPVEEFRQSRAVGSRMNGCLPIGLALRCAKLIDSLGKSAAAEAIVAQADDIRGRLDAALPDLEALYPARAEASALAYRAAGALVVAEGASGILAGGHGQRLVREAVFTLVAGSRPQIKESLLGELTA